MTPAGAFRLNQSCTNTYREGQIMSEAAEPWVSHVYFAERAKYCRRCLAVAAPNKTHKRCTKCLTAFYCSTDCQTDDWKYIHRSECRLFCSSDQLKTETDDDLLFFLKIIALLRSDIVESEHDKTCDDTTCKWNHSSIETHPVFDFPSCRKDLVKDPYMSVLFERWSPFIKLADPEQTICPDEKAFCRLYGVISGNMVLIPPPETESDGFSGFFKPKSPVAVAIYMILRFFPKSCSYNVMVTHTEGMDIVLKATATVLPGQPKYVPTVKAASGVGLFLGSEVHCDCDACLDGDPKISLGVMKCGSPICDRPTTMDADAGKACKGCGHNNKDQLVKAQTERKSLSEILKDAMKEYKVVGWELSKGLAFRIIQTTFVTGGVLHHTDSVVVQINEICANLPGVDDPRGQLDFYKKIYVGLQPRFSRHDPYIREMLTRIFFYYMMRKDYQEGLPFMKEVLDRLAVIPGKEHADYRLLMFIVEHVLRDPNPQQGNRFADLLKQLVATQR